MKNIIGFGSGTGSNLDQLFHHQKGYRLRAVFANKDCPLITNFQCLKVPSYIYTRDFEEKVLQRIESFDFEVDYIFLGGFMKILKGPILEKFEGRIINVHPADLRILGADQKRLLVGRYGLIKALLSKQKEVRSTVHLVNREVDGGKILHVSHPLPIQTPDFLHDFTCENTSDALDFAIKHMVADSFQKLLNYARSIQEEQKKRCDWPSFLRVAEFLTN